MANSMVWLCAAKRRPDFLAASPTLFMSSARVLNFSGVSGWSMPARALAMACLRSSSVMLGLGGRGGLGEPVLGNGRGGVGAAEGVGVVEGGLEVVELEGR